MEEEPKLMQVREWAKLKLIGRPLLSGRPPWVALRPLPRLVHIYCDSHLRALLRFPEDPIFLLLTIPQANTSDLEDVKKPTLASLFVITSDDRLWWIPQISSYEPAHRPAKKLKQKHLKQQTEDNWDLFEDCDIYKDTDLYSDHDGHAGLEIASMGSSKLHLICKVLNLQTSENVSRRVQAEFVLPKTSIGKFPDACLAAVGPNNLIAVVSSSRGPIILKEASLSLADFASASTTDCHSSKETRPSCLLFATIKQSKGRPQSEGLYLSPKFFNALAQGFVGARPKHLLLQGNSSGEVHIYSVVYPNHISSPMLLCDLQEPIVQLIAFPLYEASDALLVISSLGYLLAINASESEYKSIFTSVPEPSLQRLFRIDLRDTFTVHSWKVKAPVISVTVYESGQLCFHSASTMYMVCMLENVSSESTHQSNDALLTPVGVAMKTVLVCNTIPFFDVIIAVTEGGLVVPGTNTGSLVALTSRGRLVALRISENIFKAQTNRFILTEHVESCKPRVKSMEGDVMVLLDEIAVTESCTKALEAMKASIDRALSELALALRLTHDILSKRDQDSLWAHHQFSSMPLATNLRCNLEVKPFLITADSKRLCFTPAQSNPTQNVHHFSAENVSDLRLSLKVTLSNRGLFPVSPYWILLLDVCGLEKTSRHNFFFSRVINDGYGLTPNASIRMGLEMCCAGNSANSLEVNVFLCHIHEHHDEVLRTSAFSNIKISEVGRDRCEQNVAKYSLQPMQAKFDKNFFPLHASSKAACLLLSRYRVDILSLLKPPQKIHQRFDFLPSQPQWVRSGKIGTSALRALLGKFQISFTRIRDPGSWTSLTSEEWWKENGLDDVVKCCTISTDGREISGADVHGNTMLLALNIKRHEGEDLIAAEIQISASCLLMGFMVREAVLGRLKQQSRGWRTLKADISIPFQNMDQVLSILMGVEEELELLEQDAENTANLWHANRLEHEDLAGHVYSIFERSVVMYTNYRQRNASNPFWGLLSQK